MKERPVLFSGPMIRALLRAVDPKTMTRRVISPQPMNGNYPHFANGEWGLYLDRPTGGPYQHIGKCFYGVPGDRLWVRETWRARTDWVEPLNGQMLSKHAEIAYAADGDDSRQTWCEIPQPEREEWTYKLLKWIDGRDNRWRPSIHMPRWASRITLEITDVKVERLCDISEDDARAEGAEPWKFGLEQCLTTGERGCESPYRGGFACLWDDINADRGYTWKSNPWVWALTFQRITPEHSDGRVGTQQTIGAQENA